MTVCEIKAESEYGDLIREFLVQQFPRAAVSPSDKLEALTQVLVGTLQSRLGPTPKPESMVLIRKVIHSAISTGQKIPVLVPFGPKKPGSSRSSIDVAELFAVRSLLELDSVTRDFHAPGLDIRVRMEDLTGFILEGDEFSPAIERYVGDFEKLARILTGGLVEVARETEMVPDAAAFKSDVAAAATRIRRYLETTTGEEPLTETPAGNALIEVGWSGAISQAMRAHYAHKYEVIYPNETDDFRRGVLSDYFATALVRRKVKATGARAEWGRYIQINFLSPVSSSKDTPQAVLHRRHIPLRFSKTHVVPWRAKGFLEIGSGDEVTPAQVDWSRQAELDLVENHVTFSDGRESIRIRADLQLARR